MTCCTGQRSWTAISRSMPGRRRPGIRLVRSPGLWGKSPGSTEGHGDADADRRLCAERRGAGLCGRHQAAFGAGVYRGGVTDRPGYHAGKLPDVLRMFKTDAVRAKMLEGLEGEISAVRLLIVTATDTLRDAALARPLPPSWKAGRSPTSSRWQRLRRISAAAGGACRGGRSRYLACGKLLLVDMLRVISCTLHGINFDDGNVRHRSTNTDPGKFQGAIR